MTTYFTNITQFHDELAAILGESDKQIYRKDNLEWFHQTMG